MNDNNLNAVSSSSSTPYSPFFRRRTFGRAPSPPTWACYEQIPPPGSDSDDEGDDMQSDTDSQSCSDDDDAFEEHHHRDADSPDGGEAAGDMEMELEIAERKAAAAEMKMEVDVGSPVDEHACGSACEQCDVDDCDQHMKKRDKGKQRAVDPDPDPESLQAEKAPRRHRRRKHHECSTLYRPILTIRKSEGFVWNQDLFVPSYIKDRYVASTSPPSNGLAISPIPASEFQDSYEIEVVEIRVQGNELEGILS